MSIVNRDLAPEDFPFTIYCHVKGGMDERLLGGLVAWAVTLLKPPPRVRAKIWVPPVARDYGQPIWVTTEAGDGVVSTAGPYG